MARSIFPESTKRQIEAWQPLVHVCRRWRSLVFGSPRRLKMRLVCTIKTPAEDTLDVWPALPILIRDYDCLTEGMDNIIAVLERSDRVSEVYLKNAPSSHLERVSAPAAMQRPFPGLASLLFHSYYVNVPALPDSFLGGSAPLLRLLYLDCVPFPGLPKLLLSAPHLVHLRLWNISHSGYFSPEAMLTALPTLTSLESLRIQFESPRSRPDLAGRRPSPPTRLVLPVLATFGFKGVCEYLEDLVARIDAPQLITLHLTLFNQIIFDTPQLIQFIGRTPTLNTPEKAHIAFGDYHTRFRLSSGPGGLSVGIACRELDWQISSLEQVCTSCSPLLSTLENLYIYQAPFSQPNWQDNIENILWLELLHPFTTIKNL